MDTRGLPEEAPEILPSGDPEWFPNRTFVPKFLDNCPESGQQLGESYSQMQRNKRSCPPPSPPKPQTREWDGLRPETCMNPVRRKGHARQVPRTQRETTAKATAVAGRQGNPKQMHESHFEVSILTKSSPARLKGRDTGKFYLPFLTGPRWGRSVRAASEENAHPLPASAGFPGILAVGSGVSRVCPCISPWPPKPVKEEKTVTIFPLPFGAKGWLKPVFLHSTV